jgi:hypothetical protein
VTADRPRVALLTREYPPEVYGGAGVHVEYLARELSAHVDLTVHCQGADRPAGARRRRLRLDLRRRPDRRAVRRDHPLRSQEASRADRHP